MTCQSCNGNRWVLFCDRPTICMWCAEGNQLREVLEAEAKAVRVRDARRRKFEQVMSESGPERYELSLTETQLFALSSVVGRMLHDDPDIDGNMRNVLYGVARRIDKSLMAAHEGSKEGRLGQVANDPGRPRTPRS